MSNKQFMLVDESATLMLGEALGKAYLAFFESAKPLASAVTIYLDGELGAGKTTFSRGFLQAFSYTGNVKSPTYTLVEPYAFAGQNIYHFDLYRLADTEELLFLGVDEYFAAPDETTGAVCLVEWPSKGGTCLHAADLTIRIEVVAQQRLVKVFALSPRGSKIVDHLCAVATDELGI